MRMITDKINYIKIINIKRSKDTIKATLEYDSKKDPRADIFNYIVEQNWVLLKMNPISKNLEGIFRQLTSTKNNE